jgi:hypothetical protein
MTRWFSGEPVDARFFDTPPHLFRYERHSDATPEQVWESLQSAGTRFTWLVAIEPVRALRLPFKVFAPVLKAAFGLAASEGQQYFAAR